MSVNKRKSSILNYCQPILILVLTGFTLVFFKKNIDSEKKINQYSQYIQENSSKLSIAVFSDSLLYHRLNADIIMNLFPDKQTNLYDMPKSFLNFSLLVPKNSCEVCVDSLIAKLKSTFYNNAESRCFSIITDVGSPRDIDVTLKREKFNCPILSIDEIGRILGGFTISRPILIIWTDSFHIIGISSLDDESFPTLSKWIIDTNGFGCDLDTMHLM